MKFLECRGARLSTASLPIDCRSNIPATTALYVRFAEATKAVSSEKLFGRNCLLTEAAGAITWREMRRKSSLRAARNKLRSRYCVCAMLRAAGKLVAVGVTARSRCRLKTRISFHGCTLHRVPKNLLPSPGKRPHSGGRRNGLAGIGSLRATDAVGVRV